jgi:diguanylate cyclase (GGDEF)-like protein
MKRLRITLQTQLTLFAVAFLTISIGLAALSVVSLRLVDAKAEALDVKWLAATRALGELSDRISEFRIAETYRVLADDAEARARADGLAAEHRRIIEALQQEHLALFPGDDSRFDLTRFRKALASYLAAHDEWVRRDQSPEGDRAGRDEGFRAPLHELYRAADEEVDRIIQETKFAARADADAASRLAEGTSKVLLLVLAIAGGLAAWLLANVRRRITAPLGAITEALSQLAAGNRNVEVPGVERDDEIGQMAKSFDVFRANASALERAHEAARLAREQAQALARMDSLTGLPNRRMFAGELQSAVDRAENGSAHYAVLVVDIDRFKPINDLEGRRVGDAVLSEVARRLREVVRKRDVVARLGADEFAILMEASRPTHADQSMRLATRALAAIREPIQLGDRSVGVTASIGVSACPGDGLDVETLLRAADIAMRQAKKDGRGRFRFFERRMDEELRNEAALETALEAAIIAGEIRPNYQPLVDLEKDRVYGFEVLSRWTHPVCGEIAPDMFIPLAERIGLIDDLTWSVLRRACREASAWDADIRISVNISPVQLKDPTLASRLFDVVAAENFPPKRLEIEITESALVEDVDTARQTLAALQARGVSISLDDFGAGYSSLYHLRAFRFDKVKIDRAFVLAMEHDDESEKIVDAILGLSKNLGLTTVAEGVETASVLRRLVERGCEFGQGFYFGRAMSFEDAGEALRRGGLCRRVA